MANDMEAASAHQTKTCSGWDFHSRCTVSHQSFKHDTGRYLDSGSVCGISIARLVFFINGENPSADAYDVTCETPLLE